MSEQLQNANVVPAIALAPELLTKDGAVIAAARARALLDPTTVQSLDEAGLATLQAVLQNGTTVGVWQTPLAWAPGVAKALLRVDLRKRITAFLPDTEAVADGVEVGPLLMTLLDEAVLTTTRFLLLCRYAPTSQRRVTSEALDASTVAYLAYHFMPVLAAAGIAKHLRAAQPERRKALGRTFAHLTVEDINALDQSQRVKDALLNEVQRMVRLAAQGLWTDVPTLSTVEQTTEVTGTAAEPASAPGADRHKPLPDDYLAEMGSKSVWVIENLGPALLGVLAKFEAIWEKAAATGAVESTISRWAEDCLATYEWHDAQGQLIEKLPFVLQMSRRGQSRQAEDEDVASAWPPRLMAQVMGLTKTLQAAHLFVVMLSIGARRSEAVSQWRDAVRYASDGLPYADGRTYKLVTRLDGEERDWVLPDMAVQAIEQQARLVGMTEKFAAAGHIQATSEFKPGTHLWGTMGLTSDRGQPLHASQFNVQLQDYARALGMSVRPGGQSLRSHRFRKSLARLGALAIVESPKVLLDVFGHKSLEMTLYYILEDKDLRAEIDAIASELRVMRATTVVAEMVAAEDERQVLLAQGKTTQADTIFGGYGGLAASGIHQAVVTKMDEVHRTGATWGAEDTQGLAMLLTVQGTAWKVVRPGVVCTKSVNQFGPCARKKGEPEPSRCQGNCDNRLEEAWHREDVDASITECIGLYVEAGQKGMDLVQALWRDQVLSNMERFADLKVKWSAHEVVRQMLQERETE